VKYSSFLHPHSRRSLEVTLRTSFSDVDEAASAAAASEHWRGAVAYAASAEGEIGAAAAAAGSTAVDEAVAVPCGQNSDSPQAAAVGTASRSNRADAAVAAGRTAETNEGSSSHLDYALDLLPPSWSSYYFGGPWGQTYAVVAEPPPDASRNFDSSSPGAPRLDRAWKGGPSVASPAVAARAAAAVAENSCGYSPAVAVEDPPCPCCDPPPFDYDPPATNYGAAEIIIAAAFVGIAAIEDYYFEREGAVGDVELAAVEGDRLPSPETPLDFDGSS